MEIVKEGSINAYASQSVYSIPIVGSSHSKAVVIWLIFLIFPKVFNEPLT